MPYYSAIPLSKERMPYYTAIQLSKERMPYYTAVQLSQDERATQIQIQVYSLKDCLTLISLEEKPFIVLKSEWYKSTHRG